MTTLLVLGVLTGCAGPAVLSNGRGTHSAVINRTEDEQILSMIVRQRYDETYGMLAMSSVTASMKGPDFFQLHELFDKLHGELQEEADVLAERITALGSVADGRVQTTARSSSLGEYPLEALDGESQLRPSPRRSAASRGPSGPPSSRRPMRGTPIASTCHRDLARHGQAALARRGAPGGSPLTPGKRDRGII